MGHKSVPDVREFADYYIDAQKPWGNTELGWTIEYFDPGTLAVPNVDFHPNFFPEGAARKIVENSLEHIEGGNNFVIIKPEHLPPGSGWKTFLVALGRKASEKGYVVLQTHKAATQLSSLDGNWIIRQGLYVLNGGLNDDDGDENMVKTNENCVRDNDNATSRLSDWIKTENAKGVHFKKIIVIATQNEYDQELRESGVRSKFQRLSKNGGANPLPILVYPQINWKEVIKNRIDETDVNLDHLLLADRLCPEFKDREFETCQKTQEREVRRVLQLAINASNARLIGVLQGGFGVGKSVLLARIHALLSALKQENVVNCEIQQLSGVDYVSPHERIQNGLLLIDDDFEDAIGQDGLPHVGYQRTGILSASNADPKTLEEHVLKGMNFGKTPTHSGAPTEPKIPPFCYNEIVAIPGTDYCP